MRNSNEIYKVISEYLKKRNLSANKMLSDLNLHKDLMRHLKDGKMPSADKMAKIAQYFNISTDCLLDMEENQIYNNDSKSEYKKDEIELIDNYRELDQEKKSQVVGYVNALVDTQKHIKKNASGTDDKDIQKDA